MVSVNVCFLAIFGTALLATCLATSNGFLQETDASSVPDFGDFLKNLTPEERAEALAAAQKELSKVQIDKHHTAKDFADQVKSEKDLQAKIKALLAAQMEAAKQRKLELERAVAAEAAAKAKKKAEEAEKRKLEQERKAAEEAEARRLLEEERMRKLEQARKDAEMAAAKAKLKAKEAARLADEAAATARAAAEAAARAHGAAEATAHAAEKAVATAPKAAAVVNKTASTPSTPARLPSQAKTAGTAQPLSSPNSSSAAKPVKKSVDTPSKSAATPRHQVSIPGTWEVKPPWEVLSAAPRTSASNSCNDCSETTALAYQKCALVHGNPCIRLADGQIKDGLCCSRRESHNACLKCAHDGCPAGTACAAINKQYYTKRTSALRG